MKPKILALLTFIFLGAAPASSMAQPYEITPEYIQTVDNILEATKTEDVMKVMYTQISAAQGPILKEIFVEKLGVEEGERALAVYQEEFKEYYENDFADHMKTVIAPKAYSKYLSLEDIKVVENFYKTEAGQKIAMNGPNIMQYTMLLTQQHLQTETQKIIERFVERMEAEDQQQ